MQTKKVIVINKEELFRNLLKWPAIKGKKRQEKMRQKSYKNYIKTQKKSQIRELKGVKTRFT